MKLAEVAPSLIENGYRIVPIQPGTKSPNEANWPRLNADAAQVETWLQQGKADWGVGILGEHTPGVDLDISDEAMLDRVLDWCGAHIGVANKRVGRPPRVLFACQTSQPFAKLRSKKYRSPDGQTHQIEILGRGSQYVAYAVHPDTKRPYAWSGEDPAQLPADLLPSLDADKARELIAHFESIVPPDWELMSAGTDGTPAEGGGTKGAPLAQVASALKTIPNGDLDYDAWLRIGMALKGAVGDEGRDLFHEWSERSDKYDAAETDWRWDTMKPKTIGAGTLFHLASMNGWERPVAVASEEFDAVDVGEAAAPATKGLPIVCAASFAGQQIPERQFVDKQCLLPMNAVTGFAGDGGIGKSLLALQLACGVAHSAMWLGIPVRRGSVLYFSAEDEQDEVHNRLSSIVAAEGYALSDLTNLHIAFMAGRDAVLAAENTQAGRMTRTPLFAQLRASLAAVRPTLLVLDNLADVFSGNESNRTLVRQFVGLLRGLAIEFECAILLLSHPSVAGLNSGSGTSGSTAWNNSFRSRIYLRRDEDEKGVERNRSRRILEHKKANYASAEFDITLEWQAGRYTPLDGLNELDGAFDPEAKARRAERVFMELLRWHKKHGMTVSSVPGTNWAPKIFSEHTLSGGVTKREFKTAMDALLGADVLCVTEDGPPSKRRKFLVELAAEYD